MRLPLRAFFVVGLAVTAVGGTAVIASANTRPAAAPGAGYVQGPGGHHLPVFLSGQHGVAANANGTTYSSNWAGYVATGGTYTDASGSWVLPSVDCSATPTAHSSFWVGLDGVQSSTVEQTGATSDCDSGVASYYAWFELFPAPEQQIQRPVSPGDHFTGSVHYNGTAFDLTISDVTRGWTETFSGTASGNRSSAEFIAEAPGSSLLNGTWPLADFGSMGFSNATVDGRSLGSYQPDRFVMRSNKTGILMADTSALSGSGFTVTWRGTY